MDQVRILVDSLADQDLLNAQMGNAREIVSRLDERFHVSIFKVGNADPRLVRRPGTRLIQLPRRLQTLRIFREFMWGRHQILFYLKSAPASRIYLNLRLKTIDKRVVIGLVESQSDLRVEPTVTREAARLRERTILRSDVLFSNSAAVKTSLRREFGLSSEIIPTGVDSKFFVPAWDRPASKRVQVLFVGSLRPFKGPQLLIRGASVFPNVDFVIVGDGVMAAQLQAEVREKSLSNVTLTGSLEPIPLRKQYQNADIFLFPSKWEGSPKVILEAAACGLPVIARRDYQPETVLDGRTGLLGGSDDELLERLSTLIASAQARREMGEAGRAHSERFDWDLITVQWQDTFLRLISNEPKALCA